MQTFIKLSVFIINMEKKMVKIISDPEQIELFENPNYLRILSILREGEFNIKEIHKRFNKDYEDRKTLSTMYRYMETLTEHDLVYVSREELKRKHIIESYYSRTAMFFAFEEEEYKKKAVKAASEILQKIHDLDTERAKRLTELLQEYDHDMFQEDLNFYETHGKEILTVEKDYGYKILKGGIHLILGLLYYKKNPELINKIFEVLEGESL
jgi:DNA-binding transcriptional ArsR family regulator